MINIERLDVKTKDALKMHQKHYERWLLTHFEPRPRSHQDVRIPVRVWTRICENQDFSPMDSAYTPRQTWTALSAILVSRQHTPNQDLSP